MIEKDTIYNEDCLETMKRMPDNSVDIILTDPPYGTTRNEWDTIVNFMTEALRVASTVVVTASQPYTSRIIMDNLKYFRHAWVWEKDRPANILNANRECLKIHEDILVFSNKQPAYYPQMVKLASPYRHKNRNVMSTSFGSNSDNYDGKGYTEYTHSYPKSIIRFPKDNGGKNNLHPTQKPLKLFSYLIRTYTKEGDLVYDPFMGSGTTAKACQDTGRHYIGSETSADYCKIAERRLSQGKLL